MSLSTIASLRGNGRKQALVAILILALALTLLPNRTEAQLFGPPPSTYMGDGSSPSFFEGLVTECVMCDFVESTYVVMNAYARMVYDVLLGPSRGLLIGLFIAWVLWQGAGMFFPMVGVDPRGVARRLTFKSLYFVVALTLLSTTGMRASFDWIYETIMSTSLGLAQTVADASFTASGEEGLLSLIEVEPRSVTRDTDFLSHPVLVSLRNETSRLTGGANDAAAVEYMNQTGNLVHRFQISAGFGILLGVDMFGTFDVYDGKTYVNFLFSLVMIVIYAIVFLAFPFYFVSAFLRLGVVMGLMPIVLIFGMFDATKGAIGKALRTAVGTGLIIVGMGLAFSLATFLMMLTPAFIQSEYPEAFPASVEDPVLGMAAMLDAIVNDRSEFVLTGFDGAYWYMIAVGILLLTSIKTISVLVGEIVGAAAPGQTVGAMVQNLATTAGMGVVGYGAYRGADLFMNATMGGARWVGGRSGKLIGDFVNKPTGSNSGP